MHKFFRISVILGLSFLFFLPASATSAPVTQHTASDVLARAVQVASGKYHTCAVTAEATVKCWGNNGWGQLGNGTKIDSLVPVDVIGLTQVKSVSVSDGHTCALTLSGGAKCWGMGVISSLVPTDVVGLESGVAMISSGGSPFPSYDIALMASDGAVKIWGTQYFDSGIGRTFWPPEYVGEYQSGVFMTMTGVIKIDAGRSHACAATAAGKVKCWGENTHGQLGNGFRWSDPIARPVSDITNAVDVTAGNNHSCALLSDGTVKCWGANGAGQLGDGTYQDHLTPVSVTNLTGVRSLSAGDAHTCALAIDNKVQCWGNNVYSQYGDGAQISNPFPTLATSLRGSINSISAGYRHTCAVFTDGGLKCWGENRFGQIGNGTRTPYLSLTSVDASGLMSNTAQISSSWEHSCAVTKTGGLKCWGSNDYGQLGSGTTLESHVPIGVVGLDSGVQSVATGRNSSCALMNTGGVKCWGLNSNKQLGDGTTAEKHLPVDVMGLTSGVIAITAGSEHYCAITSSHGAECWGANQYGQLGLGWYSSGLDPHDVDGLTSGVAGIAAGWQHSCAQMESGQVKCWGTNWSGALGNNGYSSFTPIDVVGLPAAPTVLVAGEEHTCAIVNGQPFCWGGNRYGEMGDGTTTNVVTPTLLSGINQEATAISTSIQNICLALADGVVKCAGANWGGQLGDGTTLASHSFVTATALNAPAVRIAVGTNHTCALTDQGSVKCWGSDYNGQLGDSVVTQAAPVCVTGFVCNSLFYYYFPNTLHDSSQSW